MSSEVETRLRQRPSTSLGTNGDLQDKIALYVHWPFCVSKCPYCDFNSHVRATVDQAAWRNALLTDLAHEATLLPGRRLTSIFFGGGTPSLMEPATVEALIGAARTHWPASDHLEITLEANPNSVEAARFADLAAAGVNRLSLGLQSLHDDRLQFLGRAHSATEGLAALETAQRHFRRVSFDLIYALPGDSERGWRSDLAQALSFGTEHLSLYELTIEPGTRFATDVARGALKPLDADLAASLYEMTDAMTDSAGLPAYEISNHARPGAESRHNLTYWRYGEYAGIGPGSHGRRTGMRTMRHRKPENFLSAVARNGHGMVEEAALSPAEAADEALVMGLRLREGVDAAPLSVDWEKIDRVVASGHLTRDGSRIALTRDGRLLLDHILGEIASPVPTVSAVARPQPPLSQPAPPSSPVLRREHCVRP